MMTEQIIMCDLCPQVISYKDHFAGTRIKNNYGNTSQFPTSSQLYINVVSNANYPKDLPITEAYIMNIMLNYRFIGLNHCIFKQLKFIVFKIVVSSCGNSV